MCGDSNNWETVCLGCVGVVVGVTQTGFMQTNRPRVLLSERQRAAFGFGRPGNHESMGIHTRAAPVSVIQYGQPLGKPLGESPDMGMARAQVSRQVRVGVWVLLVGYPGLEESRMAG